jgi:PAS domain S-box-containing protein
MSPRGPVTTQQLSRQLAEANATIGALLSGQVDAVLDARSRTPVLLSTAQKALLESEERYRRIVETANEGICTIDADTNFTFVNRSFADMLGETPDALLGQSMFGFLPARGRAESASVVELSRAGHSDEREVQLVRRDGSELWVLKKSTPIRDANGVYVGSLAMMTDRTVHRRDEEALRASEQQYRQIVETTTDGIMKSDVDGRIVFVNQRFAQMIGYQPSEMVGQSLFAFMSPAARMIAEAAFARRREGVRDTLDATFHHRDGTEIYVNIAGTPLYDADGHHAGSLGVFRDVTEQIKLRSQLMVSDRMASVGTLAAGVAHEINNPLAAVLANLDYIADKLLAPGHPAAGRPPMTDAWTIEEIRAPLEDAREAAQRVRLIVRDLRVFSRAPNEEPTAAVDVEAVMESSLRMAWNEIRHRARLIKLYGRVPAVLGNEARLGQVFLNLIVNAAQAMDDGRAQQNQLTLVTRLDAGRVVIEVTDTGEGIQPVNLERIFDAFFTTKPVGVGTGLGLAICHRIVTDMGGTLTVQSQPGTGTTFRVELRPAAGEETVTVAPVAPVAAPRRRGRILVVDDEELVVRSVKRVLATEHDVVGACAAREALARCQDGEQFDVILCDLMMPDMTGMDFFRELSRILPDQATHVIFLTGGAFSESAHQFLAETVNQHLEKPFDPPGLRAAVRDHMH